MNEASTLEFFNSHYWKSQNLGISIDYSKALLSREEIKKVQLKIEQAIGFMQTVDKGAFANESEKRMVGHYWLRNPSMAPTSSIKLEIENTLVKIKQFASDIHAGKILTQNGSHFKYVLLIGIGGSALGPQFVSQALGEPEDKIKLFFFDNTDADGMDRVLRAIPSLKETLVLVVSKSGGTKETRNGQLIAKNAFESQGLSFEQHAVAVTCEGSALDKLAEESKWLFRFPLWDWVGGRTSELSVVGLLPAALQGCAIDEMLKGASYMDEASRASDMFNNPAALLAALWYQLGEGAGKRAMVVLPYADRLELFSKYLQQLVMESLGKKEDLQGRVVHQGISVYGNKGSTDQHAYIQQLRDGLNNFFACFVRVLAPKNHSKATSFIVENGSTAQDYLDGFLIGTRKALYDANRPSITITIPKVSETTIGALIALFERAVGLYAHVIGINAYDQPGVEAGKKAAENVLEVQRKILAQKERDPRKLASLLNADEDLVFLLLERIHQCDRM